MTEQTAKFGWVTFPQRGLSLRGMAFSAELFRFFFVCHCLKVRMPGIVRQFWGGFLRGMEKKEKNAGTERNKKDIENCPFFFSHICHIGHSLPDLSHRELRGNKKMLLKGQLAFSAGEYLTA